jgi:hypothetical protein
MIGYQLVVLIIKQNVCNLFTFNQQIVLYCV